MRITSLEEAKSKGLIDVLDHAPIFTQPGDLVSVHGEIKKVVGVLSRREDTWEDEQEWYTTVLCFEDGTSEVAECCRDIRVCLDSDSLGEDSIDVEMAVESTKSLAVRIAVTGKKTCCPVAGPLLRLEKDAADGAQDPSVLFSARAVFEEGTVLDRVVVTDHSFKTRPHMEAWADGLYVDPMGGKDPLWKDIVRYFLFWGLVYGALIMILWALLYVV